MWTCLVCGNENDDEMSSCICGYKVPVKQTDITTEDKKDEIAEEKVTEDDSSEKWFYELNGNQIGPISAATIKNIKRSGELTDDTFVWSSQTDEWRPLSDYDIDDDIDDDMRELFHKPETAAPIQTTQANIEGSTSDTAATTSSEDIKEKKAFRNTAKASQSENRAITFYYQILGVPQNASKDNIKQAYKNLLNVWNPSKFSNEPNIQIKAQHMMSEIDEAYEKLILHLASDLSTATQVSSEIKTSRTTTENTTKRSEPVPKPTERNATISEEKKLPMHDRVTRGHATDSSTLTIWLKIFLWASILLDIISIFSGILQIQLLSDFEKGVYSSIPLATAAANANDTRQQIIGVFQIILIIVTAILFLRWIHRANYNARQLGAKDMKFTPGWAIGWY
jgi:hypothetical protein